MASLTTFNFDVVPDMSVANISTQVPVSSGVAVIVLFNGGFKQDQINLDNLIVSNKPSPEGWADVVKTALDKLNYKD